MKNSYSKKKKKKQKKLAEGKIIGQKSVPGLVKLNRKKNRPHVISQTINFISLIFFDEIVKSYRHLFGRQSARLPKLPYLTTTRCNELEGFKKKPKITSFALNARKGISVVTDISFVLVECCGVSRVTPVNRRYVFARVCADERNRREATVI